MPTNIANAIGTQRQFTKQPVATYVSRLNPLQSSSRYIDAQAMPGNRLAHSLGIFGDAVESYISERDKQKQLDANKVEALLGATDPKSWATATSAQLLAQYGQYQLADNPYAVAYIDKMRGKHMAMLADQEYAKLREEQGELPTAMEEAERYYSFKQSYYQDMKDKLPFEVNMDSLDEGFYESYEKGLVQSISLQGAQRSANYKAERDGGFQVALGDLTHQMSLGMSNEDATAAATQKFLAMALNGYQPSESIKMAEGLLKQAARDVGSPDKIQALGEATLYRDPETLADVKVKDKIDLQDYLVMAGQSSFNKMNKWSIDKTSEIDKLKAAGDTAGLQAYAEKLQKDSRQGYLTLESYLRKAIDAAPEIKARLLEKEARNHAKQVNADIGVRTAKKAIYTLLSGGRAALGNNLTVQQYDEAGNIVTKTVSKDDQNRAAEEVYMELMQSSADPAVKARQMMAVLDFAPHGALAEGIKNQVHEALIHPSASALNDAFSKSFGGITTGLHMLAADTPRFMSIFGDEDTAKIQTLQMLMDMNPDPLNVEQPLSMFINGAEKLADKVQRQLFEDDYINMANNNAVETLDYSTEDNESVKADRAYLDDPLVQPLAHNLFLYARACGMDEDTATQQVNDTVSRVFMTYKGHILPKAFFSDISADDKLDAGAATMNWLRHKTAINNAAWGVEEDNLYFEYSRWDHTLVLRSTNWAQPVAAYTKAQFTEQSNIMSDELASGNETGAAIIDSETNTDDTSDDNDSITDDILDRFKGIID